MALVVYIALGIYGISVVVVLLAYLFSEEVGPDHPDFCDEDRCHLR